MKVMQSAQAIAHVQEVQFTSINPTPGNDPTDDIVSQSTAVALRSQNNAEERDIESLQRIEVQKCTEAEMQSMEEKDSGEITEYHVFSNIKTLSPIPIPSAPPDAPSPIIKQIIGTFRIDIS